MFTLYIGQHQRPRNPIEYNGRGCSAATLFEPGVPSRTYIGALRDLFAAQARRAPTLRRKAERCRIELRAAMLQIRPK
jgi:hypothetical protein